ncbi:sugar transferase [Staphylococcus saprophyticus]|uniref:sugar transferase n=1 Tax=Staphylococcus saprophyticus TaxID=29385 RepID=UPI0010131FC9|nr:sugar transferase [Staphylococcus saprophyticus]MDW4233707.1 sugar transferase [Staphylococcus saprophyticus]MDW4386066.1 sugar transferase [Staphylococcus saprophyticus]RXS04519.1 sugar transferase [Staphylococcus saprophyticus]RXS08945.1 sugar transferase [Staphylococcus saprophyticus]RXS20214.1 sugar transferase [Staphylococcus saprophyticus]
MKRIFDVYASLLILFYSLPLMLLASITIKISLGNPILFKQVRAGIKGKPFNIIKFRTMSNEKDSMGVLLPNDKRTNKIGDFIRKTSIDELPQLVNVVKGDLSLVGPRPLHIEYNQFYNVEQKKRLNIKPGITGWAQINGRNALSWEKKFELDVWYVENQSFKLDMYIIYKTIINVISKKNINSVNGKQVERFNGNN